MDRINGDIIKSWRPYSGYDPGLLPSGKRLHNYGKSPFFMGKNHYSYGDVP